MSTTAKPIRVVQQPYDLGPCPVCQVHIEGTMDVEVHLGEIQMQPWSADDGTRSEVEATAEVTTTLRSLDVRHRCHTTFRGRGASGGVA